MEVPLKNARSGGLHTFEKSLGAVFIAVSLMPIPIFGCFIFLLPALLSDIFNVPTGPKNFIIMIIVSIIFLALSSNVYFKGKLRKEDIQATKVRMGFYIVILVAYVVFLIHPNLFGFCGYF